MAFEFVKDAGYAPRFVAEVFNLQNATAIDRLAKSDKLTTDAIGLIGNAPQISEINISSVLNIPAAPAIDGFSSSELTALHTSTADEIQAMIANGLSSFYINYFPLGNELAAARAWIERAITQGGTGLNANIEAQIWERDRSRVLREAARSVDEATATWAARGYPMPPGALLDQVNRIDQDTRDKTAQASRDVAIKQAEIELENTRFAVGKAIEMRTAAIQAAGDYIRTLALGPQLGIQMATAVIDAKAKMAGALTSFYQAKISALELPLRARIAEATANVEVRKANLTALSGATNARVATVEAAARAAGTQAAAALNSINASSGFSGSGSTSYSYSGEAPVIV